MKEELSVAFIGFGLIGGSMAKGLKRYNPAIHISAYARRPEPLLMAQSEGIVDRILTGINEELSDSDIIFLCTPVSYNAHYLEAVKPFLKKGCILTDVGSTKTNIHEEVIRLGLEECFVGGHPMAGSERTGYEYSSPQLLENAYYVITPSRLSKKEDVALLTKLAAAMGALPVRMDYEDHDYAVAAISHVPHIIASALVNLVRDTDSPAGIMKQIAAGGFKDITRIASSSPVMWQQICLTNAKSIARLLKTYITSLEGILADVEQAAADNIYELFDSSKIYRDSISERSSGPIKKEYSIYLDVEDKSGAISTVASLLASMDISIKNIGIIHNRDFEEGVLKIVLYDEAAQNRAFDLLQKNDYTLYKR